jgi:hypothetical protein
MTVEQLFKDLDSSKQVWTETYGLLAAGGYDFKKHRPALNQETLAEFNQRANLVFELFDSMRPDESGDIKGLAIGSRISELLPVAQALSQQSTGILGQLRSHWRDDVSIKNENENFLLELVSEGTVIASLEATATFSAMHSLLCNLLSIASSLLPLVKSDSIGDLSKRAESLGEVLRLVEGFRNDARRSAKAAETAANATNDYEKNAGQAAATANTSLGKITALQVQVTSDVGAVTALIEQIKAIGGNAGALEQQITNYRATFEAFQTELDGKNKEFNQFTADHKSAMESLKERDFEIDRLTKLSDSMISGATTAGLSKSMEETRKRYEGRMNNAQLGFFVAVAFLVVSALPLAASLLPGVFGQWFPRMETTVESTPYGLLGKIVLLLPATWLTAFFTKSYAESFGLERQYAHKAALAMSVDGFKRQAEKYQEEITAEVFMEIRSNPANGNNVVPASHPLYDVLSKAVEKVLDKVKKGDAK